MASEIYSLLNQIIIIGTVFYNVSFLREINCVSVSGLISICLVKFNAKPRVSYFSCNFVAMYLDFHLENAAVGFDVLTTCQPSTVWCSRERLPVAAAQPAKVRQSCSATDLLYIYI
jgi:hypothetical protein